MTLRANLRRYTPSFDNLEARTLCTVSPTLALPAATLQPIDTTPVVTVPLPTPQVTVTLGAEGELLINGTTGDDSVKVQTSSGQVTVIVSVPNAAGGFNLTYTSFDPKRVSAIHFRGFDGNDFFQNDSAVKCIAEGHAGNDTLIGGGGADVIWGGVGDDYMLGQGGDDALDGGLGNDILWGGAGNDSMSGGDGHDFMGGNSGNDVMNGGAGDDTLLGQEGDDVLHGNDGADWVDGGSGNNYLYGDAGDDVIVFNLFRDVVDGGAGNDNFNLI